MVAMSRFLTSNGNQSVTVNTAAVAPVITASSKVYDGTLTAAILTRNLTGIIGTDVVTLTGGTATFATKDVGVGKTVTGTGFTLSGAQAGNYQVAPVSATTHGRRHGQSPDDEWPDRSSQQDLRRNDGSSCQRHACIGGG